MAEVTININGRAYRVGCEDGQESHLLELAEMVSGKVADLAREVGQVGDARLLLMASLLIADQIGEARAEIAALRGETRGELDSAGEALALGLEALADRVEKVAARLEPA